MGSEEPVSILISHRNSAVGRKLSNVLEGNLGIAARITRATGQTRSALTELRPDVALIGIEREDDLSIVRMIADCAPRPAIIALVGPGSQALEPSAIRAGADDVVAMPSGGPAVIDAVETAIALHRTDPDPFSGDEPGAVEHLARSLGSSAPMQEIYRQIERIAPSAAPVVIAGDPGVGKALCARTLHELSDRAAGPFVTIQCSTYEGGELERELFGFAGNDTAETGGSRGAFEEADGGSLFLDEIEALGRGAQARLLRYFQNANVYRDGSTTGRPVDVRLICASDEVPEKLVDSGCLRTDLFYRLNVLPVRIPSLSARSDDIVNLANTFLHLFTTQEEKAFRGISPEAEQLLLEYDWPGNAGQLKNVIRRTVVMHDGTKVTADMLSAILSDGGADAIKLPAARHELARNESAQTAVEPFWLQERRIIERAVDACHGNISQAAAALEISPSTIYRKRLAWSQSMSN